MKPLSQAKKTLIAVRPEALPIVFRTLGTEFDIVVCHTLQDAKFHLDEQVGLIVCSVHFDDGATFDFLSHAKGNPDTRSIPFFVVVGEAEHYSKPILAGIRSAAGIVGAQGFIELSRLQREVGEEKANAQLRQVIRHFLAQDDLGTSDNNRRSVLQQEMHWMTTPPTKPSQKTAQAALPEV